MRNSKTTRIVLVAILSALTLLLGMTPIGLIPLGFINLTIMYLPVIIGTLLLGLKQGLLLGGIFAFTSILSAFGLSPMCPQSSLAAQLVGASPLLAIVMCLVPRLLIPVTAFFADKAITRAAGKRRAKAAGELRPKRSRGAAAVGAAVGALTNTVMYLGLMLAFFVICGINAEVVLGIIGGTGLIAGGLECAVSVIICTAVVMALDKTGVKYKNKIK